MDEVMNMAEDRCPECGNLRVDGDCACCAANRFARQRRWRRGDRGGKRPERRLIQRRFQDTLDGVWKNERHQVAVQIDTEKALYHSAHGRRQTTMHSYRLHKEAKGTVHFYKDSLLIEAQISDIGYLIMQTGGKRMSFAYEFDGELFRTCPICYGKSLVEYLSCTHCHWQFETPEE
jgi:hypothetical protein